MEPIADIFATHTPYPAIIGRLAAAAAFGMAIGIDREMNRHRAGLRTHMLISVAAALFTIMAIELAYASNQTGDAARADLLRVIEAVTAGVAFLGAGAIIQARGAVHGLTTAAGMWLAGAIGLAAGAGYYGVGLVATIMGVIILSVLGFVQQRFAVSSTDDAESDQPKT